MARLCLARFDPSPEASAAAYRSALEIDPGLRPAWLGLSQALLASGDREGAVAAVERALSPEGPRPLDAWVEYHLGRGRAFRRVARGAPGPHRERGLTPRLQGRSSYRIAHSCRPSVWTGAFRTTFMFAMVAGMPHAAASGWSKTITTSLGTPGRSSSGPVEPR